MPPRSRPRTAEICADFAAVVNGGNARTSDQQEQSAMKLRAGCVVSAGLLLAAAANAEVLAPHQAGRSPYLWRASDFVEPDAAIPPQQPPPRYARVLLPPQEVYAVLRESGFSPLGAPRLRGNIWTIAAISGDGEDGRLFIDATNGRILSFMPAGDRFDDEAAGIYDPQSGPPHPPLPPPSMRSFQRPPAAIPHVASRAVPMPQPVMPLPPTPKPVPPAAAARPVAPAPAQSIAVESPPPAAAAPPPAPVPSTVGQVKPAPQILPTQDMPKVQDLEY
jgi:hypothetical protein